MRPSRRAVWLFGFLNKPDVDFYLNPLKLLTQQFVADLAKTAAKKRVTLMFDTYEQIGTLDDWVRELARAAHGNILFVIATRSSACASVLLTMPRPPL